MAGLVPTAARQTWLKCVLNHTAAQNWSAKLFTNDYTPVVGSDEGDFTEASGGGYAAKTLTGSSFTVGDDGVDDGEATYAAQTWTFTGALSGSATVYGVYFVQVTSGLLMFAERFASSYTPAANGDTLTVTPTIRCGDLG